MKRIVCFIGAFLVVAAAAMATTISQNLSVPANLVTGGVIQATDITTLYNALNAFNLPVTNALPRSYLAGGTLSNDPASPNTVLDVAAFAARDDSNAVDMISATGFTKNTGAWAVGTGNGALDTGTIGQGTVYNVFLIQRTDTGVTDVLFSVQSSSPTLPANYTKKRRIGFFKTASASTNILAFTQDGDYFRLSASVLNFTATNPGTSAQFPVMGTPPIPLMVLFHANLSCGSSVNCRVLFSDPQANDEAPSGSAAPLNSLVNPNSTTADTAGQFQIHTNTGAIRYRFSASGASDTLTVSLYGWIDRRGRDN